MTALLVRSASRSCLDVEHWHIVEPEPEPPVVVFLSASNIIGIQSTLAAKAHRGPPPDQLPKPHSRESFRSLRWACKLLFPNRDC